MKYVRFFLVLPVLLIMVAACRQNDSPTGIGGNNDGSMVTTTIAGVVNDETGQPVSGAEITVNVNGVLKNSAVTNKFGSFMIQNANVPSSRCVILCKKNGYFTGSRSEVPKAAGITEMRLTMQSNIATYSVNASSGGKISIGNASVAFPANGFVTSTGAPYTGTVNIAVKHLDPSKQTFYNSFSGDFTARRTDGSQTELLSYGVLRVQIKDGAGNELKLAKEKAATLTYPLAASMQKNAPESMPLWYFDETLGMWKEEGVATKSGSVYTGEVKHFSDWNCDYPGQSGTVKGRVVCNNEGISGLCITAGQRKAFTDVDGYFNCSVRNSDDFVLSIYPSENFGLTSTDIHISGFEIGEVRTLPDIQLAVCPATVKGKITDCNSIPTAGITVVEYNGTSYNCFSQTGIFEIRVSPNVGFVVEVISNDGKSGTPVSVPPINSGAVYSVGDIQACADPQVTEFYDIHCDRQQTSTILSPDGSLMATFVYTDNQTFTDKKTWTHMYDVKTGTELFSFAKEKFLKGAFNFTADGSKLLVQISENMMGIVDSHTGTIINTIPGNNGKIVSDGSAVVSVINSDPIKLALFSATTGTKIRDLSIDYQKPAILYIDMLGSTHLSNANQVQLLVGYSSASRPHIVTWDYISDIEVTDITAPKFDYVYSFNPNGLKAGFFDANTGNINIYNPSNGVKVNSISFAPTNEMDSIRSVIQYFGIATDNTVVVGNSIQKPTIYNLLDNKVQKILPIPVEASTSYKYSFAYSADSQYLLGGFSSGSTYRVWKLK